MDKIGVVCQTKMEPAATVSTILLPSAEKATHRGKAPEGPFAEGTQIINQDAPELEEE
jgi:hypothetical protein